LPKPPAGRVVVVDVAFAAGNQWKSKTKPFIDALGDRLVRYIDHHEHRTGWPAVVDDPRFLLVPNRIAHACPELVTPEVAKACGALDAVVAHADFDGALSAVKLLRGGIAPWASADEDARAVDSPGRGHTLSDVGARISLAMDEASCRYEREAQLAFLSRVSWALVDGDNDPVLDDELDTLSSAARAAEVEGRALAQAHGGLEAPGVFVVRVDRKQDNRVRRSLLMYAEERATIGALWEPDPAGGAWVTAATYDGTLDLEDVTGFEGGRTDYRFMRVGDEGRGAIEALSAYVQGRAASV
jgi:hypothetical protein